MKRAGALALALLLSLSVLASFVSCRKTEAINTTEIPGTLPQTTVAIEPSFDPPVSYRGHEIIDGTYEIEGKTYPFRYSPLSRSLR